MGSKMVYHRIQSQKTLPEVREAVKRSLMFLGGSVFDAGNGFRLTQGTNGVNFAFAANFDALVDIRESQPGNYDITANVTWSPNAVFWIGLVSGFFLVIPWIVPILFLFIDPTSAYQQAFFQAQNSLG